MFDKLNDLGFVIGAFFTIIALLLFANIVLTGQDDKLSWYTAGVCIVFGLLMMFARKKKQ